MIFLDPFNESDPVHIPLLLAFFSACTGVWLYSFSKWKNLLNSARNLQSRIPSNNENTIKGTEPHVTIQICTYNEAQVVEETIARVCSLDWPQDKLTLQVCDDSTDKESIAIIENCILRWSEKGIKIQRLERSDRTGYKAGNLQHNFQFIEGDFVAYLDADHQVTPDFLRKTIPHFYNSDGTSKHHVGLVQTPWSYYNTHQNILTECDALGLDIHHAVEQVGRFHAHQVFGFNGTGGVWRKAAIEAAGGFSWDTVTEDLLLSYKAYLRGYNFVYVRDAPQQLEVPGSFLAHIQQKQRWTKGFLQVARLFLAEILYSNQTPAAVKVESLLHLTGPIQLLCTTVVLTVYPYIVYHQIDSPIVKIFSTAAIVEPVLSAVFAIACKVPGEKGDYSAWWSRLLRVGMIAPYFALRFGMVTFEIRAIVEGLFSNDATFLTTPKEGSAKQISQKKSKSKVKRNCMDDLTALVGVGLASHQFAYIFLIDRMFEISTMMDVFIRSMNLLICFGLCWVNLSFLCAKYSSFVSHTCVALLQRKGMVCGFLFVAMINCFVLYMYVTGPDANEIASVPQTTLTKAASNSFVPIYPAPVPSLACAPLRTESSHTREPMIVFGEPRTGSNLFFDFLERLDQKTTIKDYEVVALHELFNEREQVVVLRKLVDTMHHECGLPVQAHEWDDVTTAQHFLDRLRAESQDDWRLYQPLATAFETRRTQPIQWVNFIRSIPSASQQAQVAFKVFHSHLEDLSVSPVELVQGIQESGGIHDRAHPIVLWRRRIIESFVSERIALKKNSWLGETTTASDKIRVEKGDLEDFISSKRAYYKQIRDELTDKNIPFEVYEYARDLSDRTAQLQTLTRLEERLHLKGQNLSEEVMREVKVKKQAQVPLHALVENWEDVVAWGYGGEVDDWEDLFA